MFHSFARARRAAAAAIAVFLVTAGIALATAGAPRVEVSILAEREVVRKDSSGRPVASREPVTIANPGDVIVYTLTARNAGDAPALEPRIEDPLPAGTLLLPDSVETGGASVTASLDGGKTWLPFPARVERRRDDGTAESVPAPPEAYTHLRWTLPGSLGPGESRHVLFKVRIR